MPLKSLGRGAKVSLALALVLVALFLVAFVTARASQGSTDAAEQIGTTGFVRVRNLYVDTYGVRFGSDVLLFDAGMDPEARPLRAMLDALVAEPRDVKHLFLTHGHSDHVAGAPTLIAEWKAPAVLEVGLKDAGLLAGKVPQGKELVTSVTRAFFPYRPFRVTSGIATRTAFPIGASRQNVEAIPFPGHTPGSFLYVFNGVLVAGDSLHYVDGKLQLPPGMFTADEPELRRNIARLPQLLAGLDVQVVCTGHGGCTPPERTKALLAQAVEEYGTP